jgi:hypothetical protein
MICPSASGVMRLACSASLRFGFRDGENLQIAAGDLEHQQIPEVSQQIGEQSAQILPVLGEFIEQAQAGLIRPRQDCVG